MKKFIELPKLKRGDQVAVISPSAGLPGLFPWVEDLGLQRLTEVFGLHAKEYPTTRQMGSSLQDRANDVHTAFSDPENKAVITSIGGEDQIKLLKYLDPEVFLKNPKPFFGFSDNTNLAIFLWNLGIPSYYGGTIMTQFAMQGAMHDLTVEFLKHTLFNRGEYELKSAQEYNDIGLDWADKSSLSQTRIMEPNERLFWDGDQKAEGILWGGCIETLVAQSVAGRYLPLDDDLNGTILFIETAEDIPEHWLVEALLTGFGERGWFDKFQAVLVGRPKAWDFAKQNDAKQKAEYRKQQRDTVIKTVREYNKTIPIVQNLDFGHTDPQIALPMGNRARIDPSMRKIFLNY